MANNVEKVIGVALAEVGYLEKSKSAYNKNPSVLDSKTDGAGSDNYTKYGRDMHKIYPSVMDFPAYWCDAFVDWCFYKAYGVATAKSLLGGNFDDYTVASAKMYKNKNAWYTNNPRVGDQIFFDNGKRICHTGLVYKVDSVYVYTIEGNTSSGVSVVANGGAVCQKKYKLTNSRINGYGRPKYDVVEQKTVSYSQGQFISDVERILGVVTIAQAFEKTITISENSYKNHALVTPLERYMKDLGYYNGSIEADNNKTPCFGSGMTSAIKMYQKNVVLATIKNQDGVISKKGATWKKLLGIN